MHERPERLASIDVFRGLAALYVSLFHFSGGGAYFDSPDWLKAFLGKGYLGVDVFFVISGYVIPYSLYKSKYCWRNAPNFLFRRFLRLYPAYAATCLLVVALWYASSLAPGFRGHLPHLTLGQVVGNATLTSDFLNVGWLNPAFWTLAIEAQYYVLMAIVFPLLVSERPAVRVSVWVAWMLLPAILPFSPTVFRFSPLFGVGIIVFFFKNKMIPMTQAVALLLIATLVVGHVKYWTEATTCIVTAIALIAFGNFKPKALVWLGTVSYSLYLLHIPIGGRIINLSHRFQNQFGIKVLAMTLATAVSIAFAYLLFLYIEQPTHRLAQSFRRKPAQGRGRAVSES